MSTLPDPKLLRHGVLAAFRVLRGFAGVVHHEIVPRGDHLVFPGYLVEGHGLEQPGVLGPDHWLCLCLCLYHRGARDYLDDACGVVPGVSILTLGQHLLVACVAPGISAIELFHRVLSLSVHGIYPMDSHMTPPKNGGCGGKRGNRTHVFGFSNRRLDHVGHLSIYPRYILAQCGPGGRHPRVTTSEGLVHLVFSSWQDSNLHALADTGL